MSASVVSLRTAQRLAPAQVESRQESVLVELARQALAQSPYLGHRGVRVRAGAKGVVLEGTVGSYFHKQMAQEILLAVLGPGRVENCLRVQEPSDSPAALPPAPHVPLAAPTSSAPKVQSGQA